MKNVRVNINRPDGQTSSYSLKFSDLPDDCSLDTAHDLDQKFSEIKLNIPDGWKVENAGTIGPEITQKQHLSGNQDKSKMPAPTHPEPGQPQTQTSQAGSSNLSENDGKKYTHTYKDPKTGREKKVRYGAKGYRIAPGTKKGDSYCARSEGDRKSEGYDCSGKDKNTPLCLSRKKWRCKGSKSTR